MHWQASIRRCFPCCSHKSILWSQYSTISCPILLLYLKPFSRYDSDIDGAIRVAYLTYIPLVVVCPLISIHLDCSLISHSSNLSTTPVTSANTTMASDNPRSQFTRAQSHVEEPKQFAPRVPVQLNEPKNDPITYEELAQCNGKNADKPIYVAIKGTVFDVSHNKAYQEGGTYQSECIFRLSVGGFGAKKKGGTTNIRVARDRLE